jgi:hypothetical protein
VEAVSDPVEIGFVAGTGFVEDNLAREFSLKDLGVVYHLDEIHSEAADYTAQDLVVDLASVHFGSLEPYPAAISIVCL